MWGSTKQQKQDHNNHLKQQKRLTASFQGLMSSACACYELDKGNTGAILAQVQHGGSDTLLAGRSSREIQLGIATARNFLQLGMEGSQALVEDGAGNRHVHVHGEQSAHKELEASLTRPSCCGLRLMQYQIMTKRKSANTSFCFIL